jgi:hypothetical protein
MAFSAAQMKCLALAPKFTAALSIFGTIYVIRSVLTSPKKRKLVYHRILLCISLIDLIIGICMFLSTWPIPAGTPNVYGAVGTTETCTAQGYFLQLAIMGPLFNAALSLYYLLMIRYNFSEERLDKITVPVYGIILVFGISTSIAGLPLTLYNNADLWCWQAPLPFGCLESAQNGGVTTCERGDNVLSIYRWAFFYAPLWAAIAFATISMALVFLKVHRLEAASARFRSRRDFSLGVELSPISRMSILAKLGERAKKVARQALCYVGAFYISWIWSTLTRILQSVNGQTYFPIVLLAAIFLPFQGFLNFLVYIRPRYERFRDENPDWSVLTAIRQVLMNIITFSWLRNSGEADADDYNVAFTESEIRSKVKITREADTSEPTSDVRPQEMRDEEIAGQEERALSAQN